MPRKRIDVDFEKSLAELETLVTKMEQGEYTLEDALKNFERGITLVRNCQRALKDAEQRVQILITKTGESTIEDFSDDEP
jgi:exodeoxyribonuclease VII small subunit